MPDTERGCVLERVVVCEDLDVFGVTELVLNCVLCLELGTCDVTKLVLDCVASTELEGEGFGIRLETKCVECVELEVSEVNQ